jgi:hypothetical protein
MNEFVLKGPVKAASGPCALRTKNISTVKAIWVVQSSIKKYFHSLLTQITCLSPPSRPTEGRLAIVTDAGRDAVDADGAKDEGA